MHTGLSGANVVVVVVAGVDVVVVLNIASGVVSLYLVVVAVATPVVVCSSKQVSSAIQIVYDYKYKI